MQSWRETTSENLTPAMQEMGGAPASSNAAYGTPGYVSPCPTLTAKGAHMPGYGASNRFVTGCFFLICHGGFYKSLELDRKRILELFS